MKALYWSDEKNRKLKQERGLGFEDAAYYIENAKVVDIIRNPNADKYKNQEIFVLNINNYIYLVPFIETRDFVFLKTIIPSRKFTKIYLGGK